MSTIATETSGDGASSETNARKDPGETAQSAPPRDRDTPSELPKDTVFGLLKVQRRRDVLWFLDNVSAETTLSEVAEYIAAKENDCDVTQLSADERKRVYVGLYQCNLPKLDDADVVDFDRDRGTIERGENMPQLLPYLYLDRDDATEPERLSRFHALVRSVYLRLFG